MEPLQIEPIATAELDPGERLVWSGSPRPGALALQAVPATLFGIPFAGFAVFWMYGAWTATTRGGHLSGPWLLFPLFGIPFLLVGLGFVTAPLWAWAGAGRTVYAITDRRALIIGGAGLRGVQSFQHADVGDITHLESGDGSGSLYFATRAFVSSNGIVNRSRVGFVGIPDVKRVEQLLRENVQQKAA